MIQPPHIKARIERLKELMLGLAKEVSAWKDREGPLSPLERRRCLDGLRNVIASLDDARHALAVAFAVQSGGVGPGRRGRVVGSGSGRCSDRLDHRPKALLIAAATSRRSPAS